MKKLLIILLPISLFLVSCGGEEEIQPVTQTLEETLVGKKWCLSNEDEDGFILSPSGEFLTTKKCTSSDTLGSWIIDNNLIKYSVINNSIQTTILWGEVSEYSSTQIKVLIYSNSTTTAEYIYSLTGFDVFGCMDSSANNYNPLANCDDFSCVYSEIYTYLNDVNFEQALIEFGYDNVLDGRVITDNIDTVTYLNLAYRFISDLTGIEDFTALTSLRCNGNQLTSLDLSNNTALTNLVCRNNQLTSLDVSQNTALTSLLCDDNQLTSLDVSQNTALTRLECGYNQLTSLDVSNTALTELYCINNQLTSLDVSQNTALTHLSCAGNQLTSLDLTNNVALTYLNCAANQLTSLDLRNGNNTNIAGFTTIGNNQLYCINVDDSVYSTSNWINKDPQHYFSEDCP